MSHNKTRAIFVILFCLTLLVHVVFNEVMKTQGIQDALNPYVTSLWGKLVTGTSERSYASISDTTFDDDQNHYLAGGYHGEVMIGAWTVPMFSIANQTACYFAKLDPTGEILLTNTFTASSSCIITSIVVDDESNIIVAGSFSGDLIIGNYSDSSLEYSSSVFISKFNPTGSLIWNRIIGAVVSDDEDCSSSYLVLNHMSIAPNQQLILVGKFSGSVEFGTIHKQSLGRADIFVSKMDSNSGNFVWVNTAGGMNGDDEATASATNQQGVTCVVGQYSGILTVGNLPSLITSQRTAFLLKYDSRGRSTFLQSFSGIVDAWDVDIDREGNCYVTGSFLNNIGFNNMVRHTQGRSLFVTKISTKGLAEYMTTSRAASDSNIGSQVNYSIDCDDQGNCWTAGVATGPAQADFLIGKNVTMSFTNPPGSDQLFIARFAPDGRVVYGLKTQAIAYGKSGPIHVDLSGNIFLSGGLRDVFMRFDELLLVRSSISDGAFTLKLKDTLGRCGGCGYLDKCCPLASGRYQCYRPSTQECTPEGVLCPSGYRSCSGACYHPAKYSCFDDQFLCPIGLSRCGESCYLSRTYSCCDGRLCSVYQGNSTTSS